MKTIWDLCTYLWQKKQKLQSFVACEFYFTMMLKYSGIGIAGFFYFAHRDVYYT
jgi:hypothetical protein